MDDRAVLTRQNDLFVEACRQGSWSMLERILADSFAYLDGSTGEVWEMHRYISELEAHPAPTLTIDQLAIHVVGDTAVVSARARSRPDRNNRYIDTYHRRDGGWLCIHATVWPLSG